jgi:uncharacterized protein (UPF0371 family)
MAFCPMKGFDLDKYLAIQSDEIIKRVNSSEKLYLEFGGKLCGDFHAMRVLPGYDPDTKIKMLQMIKDKIEIIFCISAKDIENTKMRGDFGMSYESVTLKTINDLKKFGLDVSAIIINRFSGEKKAVKFKQYLDNIGMRVFLQKEIEGYPAEIDKIVSEDGYGQNPYVETNKPIVVVTGAGPGSGKMSFCLSQLYFDNLSGIKSNFAKFETFPIWNLPLEHPVNIAYEASTADIGDKNMVDPYHLKEYEIVSVNYNRDIENFPILKKILEKIGHNKYKSPTDMGVSRAKDGIIDDDVICNAAKQEVIRRYFRHKKEFLLGIVEKPVLDRMEKLMQGLDLNDTDRRVVVHAREAAKKAEEDSEKGNKGFFCGSAIEVDGEIITGKNSKLLHSESACVINALKKLANIPDKIDIFPKSIINSIRELKSQMNGSSNPSLDVSEILIALAISASSNPSAAECVSKISLLKNSEMHSTHMPTKGDETGIRDIGINLTTDAEITGKIYLKE